jgi:hypothetical protein
VDGGGSGPNSSDGLIRPPPPPWRLSSLWRRHKDGRNVSQQPVEAPRRRSGRVTATGRSMKRGEKKMVT